MFSIKEIVRSVANELILLNLFEWRAVSVGCVRLPEWTELPEWTFICVF